MIDCLLTSEPNDPLREIMTKMMQNRDKMGYNVLSEYLIRDLGKP